MSFFHNFLSRKSSRSPPTPVRKDYDCCLHSINEGIEPREKKWLPAWKVSYFSQGTKAEVFKAFEASIDDEVTVPSGSFVTALYRDEEWIYVERLDGQRGFIPDRSCSFYVEDGQALPERQKISDRKKQQIFRELKKQQKWEKRTSTIRRAETFDFGQTTRQRYIKRGDYRPQNRSPFTTIDRKTMKAMKVGTLRVSANIDRFLESLPMTYDEDGEPFVKESSGEREIQYDFKARTEDELSVVRGQQLTILNTSDPNWTWVADSGENEGFVPASYFSLQPSKISDQSADVDTMLDFIVVEDFHAQHNVDMSVRKGERLKSANGSIHGWIWAGSVSDRVQGFVPACVTILASEL